MSKKCYRYFGGLLNTQAKWLNKMAEKGYRLFGQENCYTNLKNARLMK